MAYDIVIMAGQSNALGNGRGEVDNPFQPDERCFTLKDPQEVSFEVEDLNNPYLKIDRNWKFVLEQTREREGNGEKNGSLYLTFCREYLNRGLLKEGRKLLVVLSSVGGAGFARGEWGVGNVLHDRLIDMLDYALNLEEDSKIVAFLWHQGEHDTFENANLNFEERKQFYFESLKKTVLDIRSRYSNDIPFIAGEFVNDWVRQYPTQCQAVIEGTEKVCEELGNGAVASAQGLKSNGQIFNTNDTAHFCRKDIYELGERYFQKFIELKK